MAEESIRVVGGGLGGWMREMGKVALGAEAQNRVVPSEKTHTCRLTVKEQLRSAPFQSDLLLSHYTCVSEKDLGNSVCSSNAICPTPVL